MAAGDLRGKIHDAVDQLPPERLPDILQFVELMLSASQEADVEPEEMWLLATGALKRMVDETQDAPPPVDDWRSHLRGL